MGDGLKVKIWKGYESDAVGKARRANPKGSLMIQKCILRNHLIYTFNLVFIYAFDCRSVYQHFASNPGLILSFLNFAQLISQQSSWSCF